MLDRVTFSSGSNPDDYGSQPTRTVTWVLNDGSGSNNLSTAATTTVSITAINDPPALSSVAAGASFTEARHRDPVGGGVGHATRTASSLSGATVAIVGGTFAGDGDVLATSTTGTAITASYNIDDRDPDAVGRGHAGQLPERCSTRSRSPTRATIRPTTAPIRGAPCTWVLNDGSGSNNLSAAATTTLAITAVNDAPTLAGTAGSAFTENGARRWCCPRA